MKVLRDLQVKSLKCKDIQSFAGVPPGKRMFRASIRCLDSQLSNILSNTPLRLRSAHEGHFQVKGRDPKAPQSFIVLYMATTTHFSLGHAWPSAQSQDKFRSHCQFPGCPGEMDPCHSPRGTGRCVGTGSISTARRAGGECCQEPPCHVLARYPAFTDGMLVSQTLALPSQQCGLGGQALVRSQVLEPSFQDEASCL